MNQWEEEDRRRQGEMFTLVHLRQRRGQAADQAGPEQTRSKLFGYQPDPVGCHLILREQKPAERKLGGSGMYAGIACGPQGARRGVCAFGWKGLALCSPEPQNESARLLGALAGQSRSKATAAPPSSDVASRSARQAILFIEPAQCDLNVRLSPDSGGIADVELGPKRASERTRFRGRGWRRGRAITSAAVTL